MDGIPVKRNSIFFNNLLLLGLDHLGFKKKYGIIFHKDMFVLPNKKGYEVVTHFLFSKLSVITKEDYSLPWPLISKELDRVFQKTCYSHLSRFAQENIVMFPRMVPSALSTFGGDRFYEVYLAFSSYVLSKKMQCKGYCFLSRPVVTRENFAKAKEIQQLSTLMSMQGLIDTQSVAYAHHQIWSKFTRNLSECLEKSKNMLKANEDLLKDNLKIFEFLFSIAPNENMKFQTIIEKICSNYKSLKEVINKLNQFLFSEAKLWHYLAMDIGEQNESHIIDGHAYNICKTDEISKDYLSEIQKTGFTTTEENGKLSILRFMKLLQIYLKYIFGVSLKANLSQLHRICSVDDLSSHQDILCFINNLVKRLSNEVPDLEQSIENLKLTSRYSELNRHSNVSARHFFPLLPVFSFDHEAVKGRVPNINPGELFEFSFPNSKKPDGIPTTSLSISEKCFEKSSIINLTNITVPQDVAAYSNAEEYAEMASYTKSLLMDITKKDLFLSRFDSIKIEVPVKKTPLATRHSNISDLDYSTFDPLTSGSHMNESLLLEQSFESVALPDISFDD